ncbi:MAG: carboxypeptidase-like regulatory domain-containing protein [Flavobacteriales bacterium]|nr:carboxypeptidase-like regulatory domain-containing protein [Flavobacteriales bacterium]
MMSLLNLAPRTVALLAMLWLTVSLAFAQPYKLRGTVTDGNTGETVIGANVVLKGTTIGAVTDIDGRFELSVNELPPYTLVISFIGYTPQEVEVKSLDQPLKFKLSTNEVLLKEAEVVEAASVKTETGATYVESMDLLAIKEAASGDFYESLGSLKGVDMTAASLGFKIINTRGFNSTSPVRSLQLIDGVDNQSLGLNFSLGNFLGASELDAEGGHDRGRRPPTMDRTPSMGRPARPPRTLPTPDFQRRPRWVSATWWRVPSATPRSSRTRRAWRNSPIS